MIPWHGLQGFDIWYLHPVKATAAHWMFRFCIWWCTMSNTYLREKNGCWYWHNQCGTKITLNLGFVVFQGWAIMLCLQTNFILIFSALPCHRCYACRKWLIKVVVVTIKHIIDQGSPSYNQSDKKSILFLGLLPQSVPVGVNNCIAHVLLRGTDKIR